MPRSFDSRKSLPDGVRRALRGAGRTGPIGTIIPGDDVEVARDIQRIWLALQELRRRPSGGGDCTCDCPGPPGVGVLAGNLSVELATTNPGGLLWRYELGEKPTLPAPGASLLNAFKDTSGNAKHLRLGSYAASSVSDAPIFGEPHSELGDADDGALRFNYQQPSFSIGDKPGWWLANTGPLNGRWLPTAGYLRSVVVQFKPTPGYTGTSYDQLICGTWNMDNTGSYNVGWGLFYNASTKIVSFSSLNPGTATVSFAAPGGLTTGKWYTLGVTWDSVTGKWLLYINGVAVATAIQAGNTGGATSFSSDGFNIGRGRFDFGLSDGDTFLYGAVDRCLGYSVTLTPAQMAALTLASGSSTTGTFTSAPSGIGATADVGPVFGVGSGNAPSGAALTADGMGGSFWTPPKAKVYVNGA